MTPERRDGFLKRSIEFGQQQLLEVGRLTPMFYGFTEGGQDFVIATPWRGDRDKERILPMIHLLFCVHKVAAYSLLSETWMVATDNDGMEKFDAWRKKEKDRTGEWPSLEFYPGRTESLQILFVSSDTIKVNGIDIVRNAAGKITSFIPREIKYDSVGGRMTELLPPPGLPEFTAEQVRVAEQIAELVGFRRLP